MGVKYTGMGEKLQLSTEIADYLGSDYLEWSWNAVRYRYFSGGSR